MYFKYGNFQHPNGEVNLVRFTVRPRQGRRGTRRELDYEMHLQGELLTQKKTKSECQAELHSKIAALNSAYLFEGFDAGLYHDDGTPTKHFLQTNHPNNVTQNRILYRSFPTGGPEEYATCRTFAVGIGATFIDAESQIEFFTESITVVGTGGPDIEVVETQYGLEIDQIIPQTKQVIIQEGEAVGLSGYPVLVVPGPVLPAFERPKLRRYTTTGGRYRGQGYTDYTIRWRYVMETAGGFGALAPTMV